MKDLNSIARHIRELILVSLTEAGSGHTGGSLDLADIFTVLYFDHLRHDPQNPHWPDRDKVVLSIGHTAPFFTPRLLRQVIFLKMRCLP